MEVYQGDDTGKDNTHIRRKDPNAFPGTIRARGGFVCQEVPDIRFFGPRYHPVAWGECEPTTLSPAAASEMSYRAWVHSWYWMR